MRIKKGDRVVVLQGKDRGREGTVLEAFPKLEKVIVEGVNVAKRHQKARSATQQAGILDKLIPLPVSNVAVLSPRDGKPTRVGYKRRDDGTKVRICKRTGAELS